jgi:hypothetical protein
MGAVLSQLHAAAARGHHVPAWCAEVGSSAAVPALKNGRRRQTMVFGDSRRRRSFWRCIEEPGRPAFSRSFLRGANANCSPSRLDITLARTPRW